MKNLRDLRNREVPSSVEQAVSRLNRLHVKPPVEFIDLADDSAERAGFWGRTISRQSRKIEKLENMVKKIDEVFLFLCSDAKKYGYTLEEIENDAKVLREEVNALKNKDEK